MYSRSKVAMHRAVNANLEITNEAGGVVLESEHMITERVHTKRGLNPWGVFWPQGAFRLNIKNSKSRIATATDVKFFDDDTIVVA